MAAAECCILSGMTTLSSVQAGRPIAGVLRFLAATLTWGALLFLLAGTTAWPAAWAYLGVTVVVLGVYLLILFRLHPDLADERRKPPTDAKKWDKPFVAIIGAVGPVLLIVTCALDYRFGWSAPMPAALTVAGFFSIAGGGALTNFAVAHNRFFSAVVRIQRDRGHRVIDTGPYKAIRHPGYVGSILHMTGTGLALGSWWCFVLVGCLVALTVARTAREDRTLRDELEGYAGYAARVKYRMVPCVW